MKASELIIILQEAIKDHGDLNVVWDAGACQVNSVDYVEDDAGWRQGVPFFELID